MTIRKTLKRILLGISISILAILLFGVGFVILKKDEIIQFAINEANKYITTPVSVNKIDVSLFRYFPSISVEMQGVGVKSGSGVNDVQIARSERVSFSLNTFELINKTYVINGLHVENAELELTVDALGNPNYLIIKPTGEGKGGFFEINNITAVNSTVLYRDLKSDYSLKLLIKSAKASLIQNGKQLSIKVSTSLITDEIRVEERVFFDNKSVEIDSDIEYNLDSKIYAFSDTKLSIDAGQFKVTGNVDQVAKTLDLDIVGVNTSFKTINSLLSDDLATYFKDYDSKGDVYFSGHVLGRFDSPNKPMVTLDFGAKKASFFHPGYKKAIENVTLTGHFTTGKINTFKNYRLEIKDFSCELDKRGLSGNLTIRDFENYYIDLQLKGDADVNTLLLLMPEKYVQTAFGNVRMDVHLTGPIKDPKFSRNFLADGDIEIQNLSMVLTGERLPINKVNGVLSFRKNDLAVSNFTGLVGQNDFKINGFVRELGGLFVSSNSPIIIEADLKSNHLNFDELLRSNFAFRDTTLSNNKKYEFGISPRVNLKFNCDINQLNFKRFHGRNIRGQLSVSQRVALLRNISFKSMGGSVDIGGYVNNKNPDLVEAIGDAKISGLNIDSVFYVFNNFSQNWLIDKNLEGKVTSDIKLYMNFNKNLVLNSSSLIAEIDAVIENGELNNFEPMMQLSKFVEEKSLAQMRFSRMTNHIKIENRTIYLPEMEIRSNVSNILVSGTHTFDHVIDYHLSVPLKNFLKISQRSDYTENARQGINLLLKITGTTADYKISLDSKAISQSIKKDLTDERQEWKQILDKTKPKDEDVPVLEDEYFDFDDAEKDSPN